MDGNASAQTTSGPASCARGELAAGAPSGTIHEERGYRTGLNEGNGLLHQVCGPLPTTSSPGPPAGLLSAPCRGHHPSRPDSQPTIYAPRGARRPSSTVQEPLCPPGFLPDDVRAPAPTTSPRHPSAPSRDWLPSFSSARAGQLSAWMPKARLRTPFQPPRTSPARTWT
ncbi:hypothetical protein ACCO45_010840 [Purpureocillium lilacinum]|uniref:Uncharacterized protein n=1 Tax=Purpureocillium lilacinum TaxID=33203 RepID=A0ACC4DHH6_PURLI